MNSKILLVDDEQNLLDALKRSLKGKFKIETANSGAEGLMLMENEGPFAVIVSDYKMPEMNGVEFLLQAMKKAPDSIRMMLTGQADMDAAIDVINRARIFRFLSKPCPTEILTENIEDGLEQYRLKHAEKELIEKTLSGSIKVLTDVLSLVNPVAFSKALRVRTLVKQFLEMVKIKNPWQVEIAAMLSQIGCVTVPDSILKKVYQDEPLLEKEERIFYKHPETAKGMLSNIPRLEVISDIIAYQEKHYNGSGFPADDLKGNAIPLGARILKIIIDYDTLMSGKGKGVNSLAIMKSRLAAGWYDAELMNAFEKVMRKEKSKTVKEITLKQLSEGMLLADPIVTETGVIIANKGQEVTQSLLVRINNIDRTMIINEPLKIIQLS